MRWGDVGGLSLLLVLPGAEEVRRLKRSVCSADGLWRLNVGGVVLVLHSGDAGQIWGEIEQSYDGALYNALALPNGGWLAYGMRGNIFHSEGDLGPWSRSEMPVQASFYAHAVTPDGKIILVGQGSVMATSSDGGRHFTLSRAKGRTRLTALLLLPGRQGPGRRSLAVICEGYRWGHGHGVASGGIRLLGDRLSADLALGVPLGGSGFAAFPVVNFVYAF